MSFEVLIQNFGKRHKHLILGGLIFAFLSSGLLHEKRYIKRDDYGYGDLLKIDAILNMNERLRA